MSAAPPDASGTGSAWICTACGTQQPPTAEPPASPCPVCADDRQYVPADGQGWTSLAELAAQGHRTVVTDLEPGLAQLVVEPAVGIGHRGFLVRTPRGVVLFDPPGFLDEAALVAVRERGGLLAVASSHPHLCGVQVEWSRAFGGAPVWVARADARWVQRPDPAVRLWDGRLELAPGAVLVRCGGHFAGSAVLHLPDAAGGRGALLVGDTVMPLPGGRRVSFMRSYPMLLPLPERYLDRLLAALDPLAHDRLYGGFTDRTVLAGARGVVAESAALYRSWLTGSATDPDQDAGGPLS